MAGDLLEKLGGRPDLGGRGRLVADDDLGLGLDHLGLGRGGGAADDHGLLDELGGGAGLLDGSYEPVSRWRWRSSAE